MDSNLQTIIDSAMDTLSDALEDFLDTVLENAPTAAAVGGAAASTALVMNPSLPMTMASGVPPGNQWISIRIPIRILMLSTALEFLKNSERHLIDFQSHLIFLVGILQ